MLRKNDDVEEDVTEDETGWRKQIERNPELPIEKPEDDSGGGKRTNSKPQTTLHNYYNRDLKTFNAGVVKLVT